MVAVANSRNKAVVTLPSDDQILIMREFNAPRRLVWKAWTTPELIKCWWSGQRGETTLAEVDLRVGGTWRYVMLAHGTFEVAFHGEFSEILAGERLVSSQVYEALPDVSAETTATFADTPAGGTLLTMLIQHTSMEHRDGHLASGMEGGMQESMDLLEATSLRLR